MKDRTALVLGATGLTGGLLLEELLNNPAYSKVIIYTRRASGIIHSKLEEIQVDYDTITSSVKATDVFCCLGTTIKKAGSKEEFSKADHLYPLKIARLQQEAGSEKFLVITAAGSSAKSAFFYSRVKAQLEADLRNCSFPSLFIFRPGLILGNRTEKRSSEKLMQRVITWLDPFLKKVFPVLRGVPATAIAKCMVHVALTETGSRIISSTEINQFR
ncbi:hypothetical protein [Sediminibacterium ginsengisoli]|uniref:NAD(P)H-binding n=1 Tax=Sediminibacterium ginsengisoli TaxID=413434 RepID=A0A1T4JYE1_9BACT|nr:hypothetical protein [Sediminibacterium ginsengisoli]SJZ35201.1 hypothetical protein SAMN04488132_101314 [Sediminibacterium ginsengisoli]